MPVADNTGPGIGLASLHLSSSHRIVGLVYPRPRRHRETTGLAVALAGHEKTLWLLLVILINFLAIPSLIYWFNIRKKLQAVEESRGERPSRPLLRWGVDTRLRQARWWYGASGLASYGWGPPRERTPAQAPRFAAAASRA